MPRPGSAASAKQSRNPDRTKKRLLNAATKAFSKHGYDGVAVDDIVAMARVNKRMVYHYFTSKEGLYAEVLRSVFHRLAMLELQAFDESDDPAESIHAVLNAYFQFLETNPEFVTLLSWENLHRGRFIAKYPGLLSKSPVLDRLEMALRHGVARGIFRPGVNVKHLLVSLIGICLVYHSNQYTLSQSVGLDLQSPKVMKEGLRNSIDLVLSGLLSRD